MSTLGELRAGLRVVLGDDSVGSYLWSDAELNRQLADAVRVYGRRLPRELSTSIVTVAGQQEYDLPAGCCRVVRVEVVEDAETYRHMPLLEGGDAYGVGYYVYGGKLGLMPKPAAGGDTLVVRYLGPHAGLSADSDVSSVPESDEDLLISLAAAGAVERLATDEARRAQFESGRGEGAVAAAAGYRKEWEEGARALGRSVRSGNLALKSGGDDFGW